MTQSSGRPPRYPTPESLQEAIDDYFDHCEKGEMSVLTDRKRIPIVDKVTQEPKYYHEKIPPTVEGMAYHLGFHSVSSLWRYGQKPVDDNVDENSRDLNIRFRNIISRARMKVSQVLAERAILGRYEARIASLILAKHAGYSTRLELSGRDGGPITTQNYTKYPDKPLSLSDWQKQVRILIDPSPKKVSQKKKKLETQSKKK